MMNPPYPLPRIGHIGPDPDPGVRKPVLDPDLIRIQGMAIPGDFRVNGKRHVFLLAGIELDMINPHLRSADELLRSVERDSGDQARIDPIGIGKERAAEDTPTPDDLLGTIASPLRQIDEIGDDAKPVSLPASCKKRDLRFVREGPPTESRLAAIPLNVGFL